MKANQCSRLNVPTAFKILCLLDEKSLETYELPLIMHLLLVVSNNDPTHL
jgi:hypothetical protein